MNKLTSITAAALLLEPLAFVADKANEYLGAEYGSYSTGKNRNVSARGNVAATHGPARCESLVSS